MYAPSINSVAVAVVALAVVAFYIFLWWKIFSKAGHPGALSLINLAVIIPLVGPLIVLGLLIWFAFSEWPALKRT
jgi:ABC-type spermidine/putrescine transport system permease subunit II